MKRTVLVITSELPPLPGAPVAGGGLRVRGLVEALRGAGHRVLISLPAALAEKHPDLPEEYRPYLHEPETLSRIVYEAMPQVVLVEQWGLASYLDPGLPMPLAIDLHGPLTLENAFKTGSNYLSDALTKIETLGRADLLLCPGRVQKAYFLAWFLMAGASPQCPPLALVPLGMPPALPARQPGERVRVVFGGLTWPWIDPFPGLRAAAETLAERGGELALFVGPPPVVADHPLYGGNRGQGKDYAAELAGLASVAWPGLKPHGELLENYATATAAFDLYAPNAERELAITTRTLEYLWCGLPVIYGDYGELAGPIREAGAGWVLDPQDVAGVRAAVASLFDDPEETARKGQAAQKLVRERYTWDRVAGPLLAFVDNPVKRSPAPALIAGFRDYYRSESDRKIREGKEKIGELHEEMRRQAEAWETRRRERETWFENELRKKETLLESWRDKAESLQSEVAAKLADQEKLAAEQTALLAQAETRFAALENAAEERRLHGLDLERENDRLRERLAQTESDLAERTAAGEAARGEAERQARHLGELSVEINRLRFENEKLTRELADARAIPFAKFRGKWARRAEVVLVKLPKLVWLFSVNLLTNGKQRLRSGRADGEPMDRT